MSLRPPARQGQVLLDMHDLTSLAGISQHEATQRLAQEGYNELPTTRGHQFLALLLDIMREPMFLLLIAGGVIYLFLGDVREALVLLGSIFVIIGITFYQEQRTERALDALRDLSSPRALVIRDGEQRRIAGREGYAVTSSSWLKVTVCPLMAPSFGTTTCLLTNQCSPGSRCPFAKRPANVMPL